MQRFRRSVVSLTIVCAAGAVSTIGSVAKEICYGWATELVRQARHCVSSVLPPQLGFNYGPENLFTKRNAWCEGVRGNGIGESVVVRLDPPLIFRTVYVTNGYTRSSETFADNNRVKKFKIETNNGLTMTARLVDRPDEQIIRLPRPQRAAWVKFTITGVYSGRRYRNTCISGLMVDIEEYQR